MKKILFCEPRGGLNDMLNQISKCFTYAKKHNRELWVDGSNSGFLDDLGNYFSSDSIIFGVPKLDSPISVFPRGFSDSLKEPITWSNEKRCIVIRKNNEPATFNFEDSYDADVIVHKQSGGGTASFDIIPELKLTEKVRNFINKELGLYSQYDAVHIRNTDHKTDYKDFIRHVNETSISQKILLCTDDSNCQKFAKEVFGEKMVIHNEVPDTNGKPLHMNRSLNRFETNVQSLIDLFILAKSNELFFTEMSNGHVSGYTKLARYLHENVSVLNRFLG